jgi:2-hydroxychromene-2-carboxylate isomerase
MGGTVEFWFDYGSPTAYLGHWALKETARRTGASIDYRPMLLGAVFQATGNHTPMDVEAKGRWMSVDMANYAARYGIPFRMNPYFIINTLPLMRGALVAERRGELEAYSDAMFNAVWCDALNMGDPEVIGTTLAGAGFDAAAYLAGVGEQEIKEALKARSAAAVAKGVFGAPTFFVGDKMWWGQDRLDWVEAALLDQDRGPRR